MVYPLQPGQGDAIDARRLEIHARLDELDHLLSEVRAQLKSVVVGSAEEQRLTSQSKTLVEEVGALFAELDYLDDPAEFDEEDIEEDGEIDDDWEDSGRKEE